MECVEDPEFQEWAKGRSSSAKAANVAMK